MNLYPGRAGPQEAQFAAGQASQGALGQSLFFSTPRHVPGPLQTRPQPGTSWWMAPEWEHHPSVLVQPHSQPAPGFLDSAVLPHRGSNREQPAGIWCATWAHECGAPIASAASRTKALLRRRSVVRMPVGPAAGASFIVVVHSGVMEILGPERKRSLCVVCANEVGKVSGRDHAQPRQPPNSRVCHPARSALVADRVGARWRRATRAGSRPSLACEVVA